MTELTMSNKALYEILVPTIKSFDPPKYYTTRYHKVWDKKVRSISGGLTILKPVKGEWISDNGEIFIERMIPVRIACTAEEIDKIADMTADYYSQIAIMYYKVSDCVVIKNYKKD